MENNNFEKINPDQIIDFVNNKNLQYTDKKTTELLKTEYSQGQIIILKGNKTEFNSLIEFWLITQIWYGSDGEDFLFEKLIIDNLQNYTSWLSEPNRVGICKVANRIEKLKYDKIISQKLDIKIEQDYLIMNPIWNEEKVLFIDNNNYYLYFFWTGE
ncbi:hypothetical protein [Cellulophaga sp. Z1A5H]|uniref:hypothetical protein n=1 Tax=Cellulophaga sp. Z1A5H TaxID=2687291 RepID=UPI0013FD282F|nr:hypothetical protein [Cellulophaga sp. Z1A5H]